MKIKKFKDLSDDILHIEDRDDIKYKKADKDCKFEIEQIIDVITDPEEIKNLIKEHGLYNENNAVLDTNMLVNDVKRGDTIYVTALLRNRASMSWGSNKLSVLKLRVVDIYTNPSILNTIKR